MTRPDLRARLGRARPRSRRPAALLTLCAVALGACAQVDQAPPSEAGLPSPPQVADVLPQPGPVTPAARFHVAFSRPMDASLLLADASHSEAVVIVRAADADAVAAALARGKLSSRQRALLLPAHAQVDAEARAIDLAPDQPLAPGEIFLLVASRLKDAAGRRLAGNGARFGYQVQEALPRPALVAPRPGSEAPLNLRRLRLEVPEGARGAALSLAGPSGSVWTGAPPAAGAFAAELCPGAAGCAALQAGASYVLQVDGQEVEGARFTAASCRKEAPPQVVSSSVAARDDLVAGDAAFDGPVLARLEVAAEPAGVGGGDPEALLSRLCAQGACRTVEAPVSCARGPCGGAAAPGAPLEPCAARLEIAGLAAETAYLARLSATDDEGHEVRLPARRLSTAAALPHVVVSEVMSWPGPPLPQHRGQYVELLNLGPASIDLAALGLQGADGKVRPLSGAAAGPVPLAPRRRALAVGNLFDATRYPDLDPEVPVLRAASKRLLGRGLKEASPAPFSLVLLRPGAQAVALDAFSGGTSCSEGESLERVPQDAAGKAEFHCGAAGGSPGRPP